MLTGPGQSEHDTVELNNRSTIKESPKAVAPLKQILSESSVTGQPAEIITASARRPETSGKATEQSGNCLEILERDTHLSARSEQSELQEGSARSAMPDTVASSEQPSSKVSRMGQNGSGTLEAAPPNNGSKGAESENGSKSMGLKPLSGTVEAELAAVGVQMTAVAPAKQSTDSSIASPATSGLAKRPVQGEAPKTGIALLPCPIVRKSQTTSQKKGAFGLGLFWNCLIWN